MSKPKERDESTEKHISNSDDVTSHTTANDAIVNDSSKQKVFESAQSCINKDSISELQLKALDPADPRVAKIQSNRFELIDKSSETFSHSELQLTTAEYHYGFLLQTIATIMIRLMFWCWDKSLSCHCA